MIRFIAATLAAFIGAVSPAFASWEPSAFDGESGRAAMGCSDKVTDDSWLCLVVRCESAGRLKAYIEVTNIDFAGWITISVDGRSFDAETGAPGSAPYSSQIISSTGDLIAAMKVGKVARIADPRQEISPGYDVVSLEKAGSQIARVESACR